MLSSKQRRSWLLPALVAAILFLGGLASNLVGAGMEEFVARYHLWLWVLTGLAFAVAIGVAIWEARKGDDSQPVDIRHAAAAYTDLRQRYLARIARQFQYLPLSAVDFKAASAETGERERLGLAEMGLNEFHPVLCQHLRDGTALLLLDGFDEVPLVADVLERVQELIADLPHACPQTHMVVTCRALSYQDRRWQLDGADWPTVELAKLNESQIDRFITAWHQQLTQMEVVKQADVLSSKLSRAVRRPELWRLARNPLLLTVMAIVHTHDGELPDARVLLYKKVVELLLWRWDAVKLRDRSGQETSWRQLLQMAGLGDGDLEQMLWTLAWRAHEQTRQTYADDETPPAEATADIAESDLHDALCALYPNPEWALAWADQMVRLMKLRAGLLEESRPHVYRFPHRTFQEYLAGCYLSGHEDFTGTALKLAEQGVFWWQVILLAVGRWVYDIKQIDPPLGLVNELCLATLPTPDDETGWRKIWLAGQCLLEIGLARARRRSLGEQLIERLRGHLTHLITHDRLTPRERAEAGSTLSVIGDPRDFDEMVRVPAGDFTMGSSEDDRQQAIVESLEVWKDSKAFSEEQIRGWFDNELPQHLVALPDFRISKYPVINAQYARFVAATESSTAATLAWHNASARTAHPPCR